MGRCLTLISTPSNRSAGGGASVGVSPWSPRWRASHSTWSLDEGIPDAASFPRLTQPKFVGMSETFALNLLSKRPPVPIFNHPAVSAPCDILPRLKVVGFQPLFHGV